ncbi:hypothetical protein ACFIJ5_18035 (plasmid) [Haloimpatiens sp. FM7330]|uniref:hypothetical protein n=1 Tax=Haloimpatiens sp. FM7330 TaxID=3298610 RepID=UPI003640DF10
MANKFRKALSSRAVNMNEVDKQSEVKKESVENSDDVKNNDEVNNEIEETEDFQKNVFASELLKDVGVSKKKEFKNKTYYLSVDVTKEISKVAKSKKMSESKLLNDLLEKIFLNK